MQCHNEDWFKINLCFAAFLKPRRLCDRLVSPVLPVSCVVPSVPCCSRYFWQASRRDFYRKVFNRFLFCASHMCMYLHFSHTYTRICSSRNLGSFLGACLLERTGACVDLPGNFFNPVTVCLTSHQGTQLLSMGHLLIPGQVWVHRPRPGEARGEDESRALRETQLPSQPGMVRHLQRLGQGGRTSGGVRALAGT